MTLDQIAVHRRSFIGGSDTRIIMGDDEAALAAPLAGKRGEADPEDLSGNLIVQLGGHRGAESTAGTKPKREDRHGRPTVAAGIRL